MNREQVIPDWQTHRINKQIGLLSDDTTYIPHVRQVTHSKFITLSLTKQSSGKK